MKDMRYQAGYQVSPLLITEGAVGDESVFVKVTGHWLTILFAFGDVDTAITVSVYAASAGATTSEEQIAINHFNLSGKSDTATMSDTWAGWSDTANDATGVITLTASTDSWKWIQMEIDPAVLPAGKNYVHVVTAGTSFNSPTPAMAVIALQETRYGQDVPPSST